MYGRHSFFHYRFTLIGTFHRAFRLFIDLFDLYRQFVHFGKTMRGFFILPANPLVYFKDRILDIVCSYRHTPRRIRHMRYRCQHLPREQIAFPDQFFGIGKHIPCMISQFLEFVPALHIDCYGQIPFRHRLHYFTDPFYGRIDSRRNNRSGTDRYDQCQNHNNDRRCPDILQPCRDQRLRDHNTDVKTRTAHFRKQQKITLPFQFNITGAACFFPFRQLKIQSHGRKRIVFLSLQIGNQPAIGR